MRKKARPAFALSISFYLNTVNDASYLKKTTMGQQRREQQGAQSTSSSNSPLC
jgi:hypothetical protein